jgi:hypothetical protein
MSIFSHRYVSYAAWQPTPTLTASWTRMDSQTCNMVRRVMHARFMPGGNGRIPNVWPIEPNPPSQGWAEPLHTMQFAAATQSVPPQFG